LARLKGQSLPLDFMVALFIFLVLLAYFLVVWDVFSDSYNSHTERVARELSAITLSDQLVGHFGSPENWTESPETAASIGLAMRPGELDSHKLCALFGTQYVHAGCNLTGLQYGYAKTIFGLDKDFFVKVESPGGVLFATMGEQPENASRATEVTRIAMLDGSAVFLRVQVYD
jgi:hypothetical protein